MLACASGVCSRTAVPAFCCCQPQHTLPQHVMAACAVFKADGSMQSSLGASNILMLIVCTMCRYNLLCELAALQPGWSEQLDNATSETLAVWLCSRCVVDVLLNAAANGA